MILSDFQREKLRVDPKNKTITFPKASGTGEHVIEYPIVISYDAQTRQVSNEGGYTYEFLRSVVRKFPSTKWFATKPRKGRGVTLLGIDSQLIANFKNKDNLLTKSFSYLPDLEMYDFSSDLKDFLGFLRESDVHSFSSYSYKYISINTKSNSIVLANFDEETLKENIAHTLSEQMHLLNLDAFDMSSVTGKVIASLIEGDTVYIDSSQGEEREVLVYRYVDNDRSTLFIPFIDRKLLLNPFSRHKVDVLGILTN